MNIEERWLVFRRQQECEIIDCNRCAIDFAQTIADQAVKAERERVADDIEKHLDKYKTARAQVLNVRTNLIAQLRGDK